MRKLCTFWTPLWEEEILQESQTYHIKTYQYCLIWIFCLTDKYLNEDYVCLGSWFAYCSICMKTPWGKFTCLEQQTRSWWELEHRGKVQYTLEGGSNWDQDWLLLLFHFRCWMRNRLPCRDHELVRLREEGGKVRGLLEGGREGPSCQLASSNQRAAGTSSARGALGQFWAILSTFGHEVGWVAFQFSSLWPLSLLFRWDLWQEVQ